MRLGEHDLSSTTDTTILKDVQVKSIMNHESYAPATGSLNNDITVLELMEEVDLDTYTPACMAQVGSCVMMQCFFLTPYYDTFRPRTPPPSTARTRWCTAGGPLPRAGACPRCYWR